MDRKLKVGAALALGAILLAGGSLLPVGAQRFDEESSARISVTDAAAPVATTPDEIPELQARVAANDDDPKLHAQLGLAYLRKARDEAAPSQLPLAEEQLTASLQLQSDANLEAFVGMASLANARHDFSRSVRWSRKAIATNPYNAAAYGLLGDALFELGRVRAADAAYQKMVDVRPDVASYVRASYALSYHRRTKAALEAMRLALQAAGPTGETSAWVRHQMGDIYAGLRDLLAAARENRIGIAVAPGYIPPTVGLAETYIARGRLSEALAIMATAAVELPSLEYMITLGELYEATGQETEAEAQYGRVAAKLREYRSAGVLTDADFTVFYADQGSRLIAALREARVAYANRPTPKMADALAWILHAAGRDGAARRYAEEALRGPADATVAFHAAAIADALGDHDRAGELARRALSLDPRFSLVYRDEARRLAIRSS